MTWNGAGAWLIFSQSRHVNFSRTCWITLPLPWDHLQRLGDILAQLAPPRATAAQANGRSGLDHPLARQMLGEGLARRTLASKRHHIGGLGHGPLGDDLVLSGRTLKLLERQLHLIEQPDTSGRQVRTGFRQSIPSSI